MRVKLSRLAWGAVLTAWGCGSNGPSAATTPSPSITIGGPATLVVGQVLQYTATTTSGQDVSVKSNWTTSDSSVAKTTPWGVVTALASGTVTLTAIYQRSLTSTTVVVNPSLVFLPAITACGTIVKAGSYFLDADIPQDWPAGLCLTINVGGVHLDCRNHSVSGVHVSGASAVTISHCTVTTDSLIAVNDSSNVTLDHDTASFLEFLGGHDNAVLGSTVDGGYDGRGGMTGQDDGILLGDETNDRIEGNTIQNVWDAGIEGLAVVANTVIANNTIINTGFAGISSYWCTSWTGDTMTGNTVSRSENLMFFNYRVDTPKCLYSSTPGAFVNNRMVGNTFRDLVPGGGPGAMTFDFGSLPGSAVSNNLIQGNDMGTAPGPYTVPASGFINGGGNICASFLFPFCGG